jgi:hypothetical protein
MQVLARELVEACPACFSQAQRRRYRHYMARPDESAKYERWIDAEVATEVLERFSEAQKT